MARTAVTMLFALGVGAAAWAQEAPQEAVEGARTHTVQAGETLWGLAGRYLGDPFRWPALYEANRNKVLDPNLIYPGQELVIPRGLGVQGRAVVESVVVESAVLPPEATERTIFYQSTAPVAVGPTVLTRLPGERPAVLAGDHYGAGWLEPEPVAAGVGQVVGVSGVGTGSADARMARPFDRVRIVLAAGEGVEVGERLLVVRPDQAVKGYGRVMRAVGMVTVSGVEPSGAAAMAVVSMQFGVLLVGDQVRRLEPFQERVGVHPREVEDGLEARVVAFRDPHELPGPGDVAYLDVGADQGVQIGDEFVVLAPAAEGGSERAVARLQVVDVRPATSSVRVVRAEMPLRGAELRARLAAKMP